MDFDRCPPLWSHSVCFGPLQFWAAARCTRYLCNFGPRESQWLVTVSRRWRARCWSKATTVAVGYDGRSAWLPRTTAVGSGSSGTVSRAFSTRPVGYYCWRSSSALLPVQTKFKRVVISVIYWKKKKWHYIRRLLRFAFPSDECVP